MSDFNPAEASIGHGKKIEWSDTINGTYTKIPGTVNLKLPEAELGKTEITNDDTADFHKDYDIGMYEPGEMDGTYRYGKTAYAAMSAVFLLGTVAATRASATKFWKVTLPDGSVAAFKGFMTKNHLPLKQDPTLTCEFALQARSKITWTSGAGS